MFLFFPPSNSKNVLFFSLTFENIPQSRLGIIAAHASLEAILVCFNHFPLFALLLRLKEPARLPGIL